MKLIPHFGWDMDDILNMTPFERDCYIEISKQTLDAIRQETKRAGRV